MLVFKLRGKMRFADQIVKTCNKYDQSLTKLTLFIETSFLGTNIKMLLQQNISFNILHA